MNKLEGNGPMAMHATDLEKLSNEGLRDVEVTTRRWKGDGEHYAAQVVSDEFEGKSRVQQHQLGYQALRGRMGTQLHALQLQTSAPGDS